MQKKIIALAVAGLASTAAFAQTNVQIYGIFDYGYSYRWDNLVPNTVDSNSAFNGGQASGSRLGFKGTEDLGNGLKAVFLFEQGLSVDTSSGANTDAANTLNNTGKTGSNNSTYTRQAYAGLTGNFGTLIGGRMYTPHFALWSGSIDPFGAGTVGQYANVMGGAAGGDVVRVDNAVAYVSPSFGGFTVTGAYSNKLEGNESVDNGQDAKVYALLGRYTAGGLDLGLNYHYARFEGAAGNVLNAAQVKDTYNITLGGNYDFKFMKLHGAIAYNETSGDAQFNTNSNLEIMNYFLGVTVPVGKFDLKGSILFSDADNWGDATQYAIGANYNLSKRTDIYTAYSYIDADDTRAGAVALQGVGGLSPVTGGVGDANNSGRGMGQGVQLGLRHKF
jgi:predicted porin